MSLGVGDRQRICVVKFLFLFMTWSVWVAVGMKRMIKEEGGEALFAGLVPLGNSSPKLLYLLVIRACTSIRT